MERPWLAHYEKGVPHSIAYPDAPLHAFLEQSARSRPAHTAIIFPGAIGDARRLTYAQLDESANRFANVLLTRGLKRGARVALILPNSPQFVISYYGILKAGGSVVALNPLLAAREIEAMLADTAAEFIVVLSPFYKMVAGLKNTSLRHIIVTNIKEYLPPISRVLFSLIKEKKEGHRVDFSSDAKAIAFQKLLSTSPPLSGGLLMAPDETALLQYTGGTTGTPKAAMATHRGMVANTLQMKEWITDLKPEGEVMLGVMPLFHAYGMVSVMSFAIATGSAMVLLPRFEIQNVLKVIRRYRPSIFPGVPTMYVAINNYPGVERFRLGSIRDCISGGAPLPVEVQARFEELTGGKLVEGYGLSEAPVASHCNPVRGLRKPGSIGVPLPDVEAKIVDIETGLRELPAGEAGELAIRAPQLMKGYWNRDEETKKVIRDGWLYTGDIARMDEDGYFFIVDRKKELIIAGGYNIYPREVEEVLYLHPKVKEAVCYGVPDEYRGETVKVSLVLKDGEQATEQEIVDFCRDKLARYKLPKKVEFRKDLPKTMIGKVLRRVLVEEENAKKETSPKSF